MRRHLAVYMVALSFLLGVTPRAPTEEHQRVTFTTIDPPGAIYTESNDINRSGEIVGRYYDGSACILPCVAADGHNHGYLLSGGRFTTIDAPRSIFTGAIGINPRGEIVGRYQTSDGRVHGFLLSGGTFTSIDFSATFTTAQGINQDGDIVGAYDDAGRRRHGFLLSGGEFTSFDVPGAILTLPWKINRAGEIIGRYQSMDGKSHVFLLSGGQFISFDLPGAFDTAPAGLPFVGINARGDIVSTYCDAAPCSPAGNGNVHGFLLSGGEFTSIDFPGASLTLASGINARGDIVGVYKETFTTTCAISPGCAQGHGYLRTRRERDEDKDKDENTE